MTPLNPIMNYSPIIKNNILNLYAEKLRTKKNSQCTPTSNHIVEGFEVTDLTRIV